MDFAHQMDLGGKPAQKYRAGCHHQNGTQNDFHCRDQIHLKFLDYLAVLVSADL
jgi:hypothetical protein